MDKPRTCDSPDCPHSIRLACTECDRDDFDGVSIAEATRLGWTDIDDVVPTETSAWWTHLGLCPDCDAREGDE